MGTVPISSLSKEHGEFDHTNMTIEWGFNEDHEWTTVLYGCSICNIEPQKERFPDKPKEVIDHSKCDDSPCFACKAKGLQVNTGDASRMGMTKKAWDSELDFYKSARKQGIQPEGTSRAAVEKALNASEIIGKAYDGNTMPKASTINEKSAEAYKEVGAV